MKNQKELLTELLGLALTIQEKGIATAFFDYGGHVNCFHVRLFTPQWNDGVEPAYSVERYSITPDKIEQAIEELRVIAENGVAAINPQKVLAA